MLSLHRNPTYQLQAVLFPELLGLTAVAGGALNVTSDAMAREGRPNKKSKWDKVDVDQESFSSVGAHAALLSAAKAGSGYSAFAQQRRREAEDKRSGDRKSDRR